VKNGIIEVKVTFPGLTVQVSSDEGKTWFDYRLGVSVIGSMLFATRFNLNYFLRTPVIIKQFRNKRLV